MNRRHKLNLQLFAEQEPTTQPAEGTALPTEGTDVTLDAKTIPYDRFKQKVDETNELKRKLAEIETAQAEAQRKQLEEQNEYKALYEQAQAQIAASQAAAVDAKKEAALIKAGYTAEQVTVLKRTLVGETDEELTSAVAELASVIAPTKNYIDQSPMGAGHKQPEPKKGEGLAETLFNRVKPKK